MMNWAKTGLGLVAVMVLATAAACGDDDPQSIECGNGTYNINGLCLPIATASDGGFSCGPGTRTENGRCVAIPGEDASVVACGPGTSLQDGQCVADEAAAPTNAGPVGSECDDKTDCTSGFCATTALNPRLVDGYCTVLGCGTTNPCPAGSACIASGGLKACFAYCDPGSDVCRDGYVCQPLSDDPLKAICAPKCEADADCPAGGVCDTASGACTPPPTCEPGAAACGAGTTCMPTDVSPTGGYCFPECADATSCKATEVCQPLGAGAASGVCVPPPCADNAQCPAGATCQVQSGSLMYCQPPETCTDTCAAAEQSCVGGMCLTTCSAGDTGDTECKGQHPDLLCADTFGVCMPACDPSGACGAGSSCFTTDWVCLPTGSFPGSPCHAADATSNEPYCLAVGPIDQECVTSGGDSFCVPTCTADAECEGVSPLLTCVESQGLCVRKCAAGTLACDAGYACETNNMACLPAGAFPGSPCDDTVTCATNFDGANHDLKCEGGTCLIDCAAGGDALCSAIGTALGTALGCEQKSLNACLPSCGDAPGFACAPSGSMAMSCFDPLGEKVCMPTGAFPGSPCRTSDPKCDIDLKGNDDFDLACFPSSMSATGTCLLECSTDTDCSSFNPLMACFEDRGACFQKCATNAECGYPTSGMACLTSEGVCLPTGSFPGGPCKTDNTCDAVGPVTQSCVNAACVPDCNEGQSGDAVCAAINEALTCMPTNPQTGAGSCVYACSAGACPGGYTCLEPTGTKTGAQNACLPNGSFPGSACATGDVCGSYGGKAMTCSTGTCVITCNADADCASVGLTCVEAAQVCVQPCTAGACADNRTFCLASENACLPLGSYPGGPCAPADTCGSVAGLAMACKNDTCLIDCATGSDTLCAGAGTALGLPYPLICEDKMLKGCVPQCTAAGDCSYAGAYSCFDPAGEEACLPTGSFPGSACRSTEPKCDSDLGGNPDVDMVCAGGSACLIDCSWNPALCTSFGLTCTDMGFGSACM